MIDQLNKASEITNVDWDRHYSPTGTSIIMMTTGHQRIDDGDTTTAVNDRDIPLDTAQNHRDNGSNDDQPNRDIVKMVTIEHEHHDDVATNNNNNNNSEVQRDDKGSFDMSYYRGQQRWHHHRRRHSHPEHRSGGLADGKTMIVEDQDSFRATASSWNDDDNDPMTATTAIVTPAATGPSSTNDSSSTSIPMHHTHNSNSNISKKQRCNIIINNIPLSSLPIDALQTISTYCTSREWLSLSSTSQHWRYGMGSEVFGRVRRHAGLCALEVGMAWVSVCGTL